MRRATVVWLTRSARPAASVLPSRGDGEEIAKVVPVEHRGHPSASRRCDILQYCRMIAQHRCSHKLRIATRLKGRAGIPGPETGEATMKRSPFILTLVRSSPPALIKAAPALAEPTRRRLDLRRPDRRPRPRQQRRPAGARPAACAWPSSKFAATRRTSTSPARTTSARAATKPSRQARRRARPAARRGRAAEHRSRSPAAKIDRSQAGRRSLPGGALRLPGAGGDLASA